MAVWEGRGLARQAGQTGSGQVQTWATGSGLELEDPIPALAARLRGGGCFEDWPHSLIHTVTQQMPAELGHVPALIRRRGLRG